MPRAWHKAPSSSTAAITRFSRIALVMRLIPRKPGKRLINTSAKRDTDWKTACETADVGLTSAEAAFAETGSIVVSSGANTSRMVSLLPPVHIAMVPESKLTADIFTWTAARKGSLPANTVFVSGPSKTADIEMTLVKGVHGPKRFIVILYGD
jgi:L-lactate dehydrogenase complex protein LldG